MRIQYLTPSAARVYWGGVAGRALVYAVLGGLALAAGAATGSVALGLLAVELTHAIAAPRHARQLAVLAAQVGRAASRWQAPGAPSQLVLDLRGPLLETRAQWREIGPLPELPPLIRPPRRPVTGGAACPYSRRGA